MIIVILGLKGLTVMFKVFLQAIFKTKVLKRKRNILFRTIMNDGKQYFIQRTGLKKTNGILSFHHMWSDNNIDSHSHTVFTDMLT